LCIAVFTAFTVIWRNSCEISSVASPKFWGYQKTGEGKVLDFRLAAVVCMGYHLSKHKMTGYSKIFGGAMASWAPLATPMCGISCM